MLLQISLQKIVARTICHKACFSTSLECCQALRQYTQKTVRTYLRRVGKLDHFGITCFICYRKNSIWVWQETHGVFLCCAALDPQSPLDWTGRAQEVRWMPLLGVLHSAGTPLQRAQARITLLRCFRMMCPPQPLVLLNHKSRRSGLLPRYLSSLASSTWTWLPRHMTSSFSCVSFHMSHIMLFPLAKTSHIMQSHSQQNGY